MIVFEKDVRSLLPYDRKQYLAHSEWYGVSFQLNKNLNEINLINFVKMYNPLFENIVSKLDTGLSWIVNHDDKDLDWFPNDEDNLPSLRTLFKQHNISNKFKGALVLTKDDLLHYSKDLISYPFAVFSKESSLYKNLDISHEKIEFIIKISGHLNIDLLSTDTQLLKKIIRRNTTDDFILKPYSGTAL